MTAALAVGEYLAALVVALMYSGGQFLEAFAERHARREMTAILSRVPRTAVRYRRGVLEEIGLADIVPGASGCSPAMKTPPGRWNGFERCRDPRSVGVDR